jgi:sugar-specific transcriptional regulator TrmB
VEEKNLIEHLMAFGLTGQEAQVYLELFRLGTSNGYEIAKSMGISRSNVYKALEGLADKGGAYAMEGTSKKYTPVDIEEFCQNKLRSLDVRKELLVAHMPREKEEREGYFTISSDENITDKVRNMLTRARSRVYLSMSSRLLAQFQEELELLARKKIKVVVLTSAREGEQAEEGKSFCWRNGIKVYYTEDKNCQIGIIMDSKYVLTGELGKGKDSTCLYSGQMNFVQVFKDSMKNEIRLLELEKGQQKKSKNKGDKSYEERTICNE